MALDSARQLACGRGRRLALSALLSLALLALRPAPAQGAAGLSVRGPFFVASDGRVTLLRGVNISNAAKTAPFDPLPPVAWATAPDRPTRDRALLAPLGPLGMNVIRVLFLWEAYEPERGRYVDAYLERFAELAATAWSLGLYTIIDIHQDGFSRYVRPECGDGFPAWAARAAADPAGQPPYKDCGTLWAVKTAVTPAMHRAYARFYRNEGGARAAFIEVARRLAARLKNVPGVIGYDLVNELWGDDNAEILPLESELTAAIRGEDPTAITFVEPSILSVLGVTGIVNMDRPRFGNFAYSPHFYDALAAGVQVYLPGNPITDGFFKRMPRQARDWGVPLFVGEFGGYARTKNLEAYIARQYDLLDDALASCAQWNYTPSWTPQAKDGWNDEDYSIIDDQGQVRATYTPHPYPRLTAGKPLHFAVERDRKLRPIAVVARWRNEPGVGGGLTEIYLPWRSVFQGRRPTVRTRGPGLSCEFDADGLFLDCKGLSAGVVEVRVGIAPARKGD